MSAVDGFPQYQVQNGPQVPSVSFDDNGNPIYSGIGPGYGGYGIVHDNQYLPLYNPGGLDPSRINPALYEQIQYLQNLRGDVSSFFDPALLAQRRQLDLQRGDTAAQNRFAQYGLSGSSAEFGARGDVQMNTDLNYRSQEAMQRLQAAQMEAQLTGQIGQGINTIQQGYSQFQNQYLNTVLGFNNADAQAQAANNQMIGQGIGALGSIAGFALAGPAGAAGGAALGKVAGAATEYGIDGNSGGWTPDYSGAGMVPSFNPPGPMGDFGAPQQGMYQRGYFT
jgi:hypothetical protein